MQSTEAVQAVSGWGQQAPMLALCIAGGAVAAWLVGRHLKETRKADAEERAKRDEEARKEREARDALHAATVKALADRWDVQAERCHEVQQDAAKAIRENSAALSTLKTTVDNCLTMTQNLGHVAEEARRELERNRERERLAPR